MSFLQDNWKSILIGISTCNLVITCYIRYKNYKTVTLVPDKVEDAAAAKESFNYSKSFSKHGILFNIILSASSILTTHFELIPKLWIQSGVLANELSRLSIVLSIINRPYLFLISMNLIQSIPTYAVAYFYSNFELKHNKKSLHDKPFFILDYLLEPIQLVAIRAPLLSCGWIILNYLYFKPLAYFLILLLVGYTYTKHFFYPAKSINFSVVTEYQLLQNQTLTQEINDMAAKLKFPLACIYVSRYNENSILTDPKLAYDVSLNYQNNRTIDIFISEPLVAQEQEALGFVASTLGYWSSNNYQFGDYMMSMFILSEFALFYGLLGSEKFAETTGFTAVSAISPSFVIYCVNWVAGITEELSKYMVDIITRIDEYRSDATMTELGYGEVVKKSLSLHRGRNADVYSYWLYEALYNEPDSNGRIAEIEKLQRKLKLAGVDHKSLC